MKLNLWASVANWMWEMRKVEDQDDLKIFHFGNQRAHHLDKR